MVDGPTARVAIVESSMEEKSVTIFPCRAFQIVGSITAKPSSFEGSSVCSERKKMSHSRRGWVGWMDGGREGGEEKIGQ